MSHSGSRQRLVPRAPEAELKRRGEELEVWPHLFQTQPCSAGWSTRGCHLVRLTHVLFRLFSKEKGERWRRQFSVVCGFDLRLWLWSFEILKYFLGTPSPKLPIGTNVFSKMKTLNKEVEPGPGCRRIRSGWCRPPALWSRPGWPASSGTGGCTHSAPPSWPHPGSWRGPVGRMERRRRCQKTGLQFSPSQCKNSVNLRTRCGGI